MIQLEENSATVPLSTSAQKQLARASQVSLVVSVLILLVKFYAYHLTHSQVIFSDALESIANVVAAALALVVLAVAGKPADRDHPYGHGKVEFFSAAFEGGLIFFAAIMIFIGAIQGLVRGIELTEIGLGLALTVVGGILNAILGWYLVRTGRKFHSEAIVASGKHVLSDFWTSIGVLVGLSLVHFTGLSWFDPIAALVVGGSLARTGVTLVRRSAGGLLDEEDRGLIDSLLQIVRDKRPTGFIQIHHVRVLRSGRYHHIDAHVVVPEFWDVAQAHERAAEFESIMMREYPQQGELHLHVDPCRRKYCRYCDVHDCGLRRQPFERKMELSIEELTSPEEPLQFLERTPSTGGNS